MAGDGRRWRTPRGESQRIARVRCEPKSCARRVPPASLQRCSDSSFNVICSGLMPSASGCTTLNIASGTVESGLRLLQFLPPFRRLIRLAPSVVLLNQALQRIDEALPGSWVVVFLARSRSPTLEIPR